MRGSKGGFWDRLFARIRNRKIVKKKKLELEEEKRINSKKEEILKIKKEEQELYSLNMNNKVEVKPKKRSFKIHKKGISSKIQTYPNINKKDIGKTIVPDTQSDLVKAENVGKKRVGISPKVEKKSVSTIAKKKIPKMKKDIPNSKITNIKDNTTQLNEKSQKLIDELNKVIDDNREKISIIAIEIDELRIELNEARTIKKVEEIEKRLMELKRKLIELMETYSKIKDVSFSKIKHEKIENLVTDIKKLDPNFRFDEIANKVTPNLDYYNDMSNSAINTVNLIYSTSYQKDIINYKNTEEQNMNIELNDLNEINNRLSSELNKHKDIIHEFNILISKISPEKVVDVQNDFLATMLHNTGCLIGTFLSIPFLKKPQNVPLFAFGLFTINNSIRNMRKVTTTETISYIPSDDYANQIIKYKNSFGFVDYMISDSLYQISTLKEEYKINFASFHNTEEFNKNLRKIDAMESKILKQSKEIEALKNKYENTLDKNYKKVLAIKNK